MPRNASGRQPSPECCRPGKQPTITTTETVNFVIDIDPLRVNSLHPNRALYVQVKTEGGSDAS
jgi:hypothetical protein